MKYTEALKMYIYMRLSDKKIHLQVLQNKP